MTLSPVGLSAAQLTGDRNIWPDDATRTAIARSGQTSLLVQVEVCVGPSGTVSGVTFLRSSGFPAYDARLADEIRTWTYRPFLDAQGVAVTACGQTSFSYRQQ